MFHVLGAHDFACKGEGVKNAVRLAELKKKLAFIYFDRDPPCGKLGRFLDARKKPGEDAPAFAYHIRFLGNDNLAREPGRNRASQKLAKELLLEQMKYQFVNGLRDPDRTFVLSKATATFGGSVEAAVDRVCNELLATSKEKVRRAVEPQEGSVYADVAQLAESLG